jgi:hypothetical protein
LFLDRPATAVTDDTDDTDGDAPLPADVDEAEVVRTAAEAAEGLVLSRFRSSQVADLDVTVTFEDAVLEVDVYLNVPDPEGRDPDQVADDAAVAARAAVDDLIGT